MAILSKDTQAFYREHTVHDPIETSQSMSFEAFNGVNSMNGAGDASGRNGIRWLMY